MVLKVLAFYYVLTNGRANILTAFVHESLFITAMFVVKENDKEIFTSSEMNHICVYSKVESWLKMNEVNLHALERGRGTLLIEADSLRSGEKTLHRTPILQTGKYRAAVVTLACTAREGVILGTGAPPSCWLQFSGLL